MSATSQFNFDRQQRMINPTNMKKAKEQSSFYSGRAYQSSPSDTRNAERPASSYGNDAQDGREAADDYSSLYANQQSRHQELLDMYNKSQNDSLGMELATAQPYKNEGRNFERTLQADELESKMFMTALDRSKQDWLGNFAWRGA